MIEGIGMRDISKMKLSIPDYVNDILKVLHKYGYKAYCVGGCVRDSILGVSPHDWDVCTNARTDDMMRVFKKAKMRVLETGIKHGTVTVLNNSKGVEVTTFRIDGKYTDHRRPDSVIFTSDLKADLSRRDFTVNAMAYSPKDGIIDLFGGYNDLVNRVLRTVGDPDERFNEDGLRIMRAIRFSATKNLTIDLDTLGSINRNKSLLKFISAERLNSELCKLLMTENTDRLLLLLMNPIVFETLKVFIPEIEPMINFMQNNPYHIYDVWEHTVRTICATPVDRYLRLSALFHDIGKPSTYTVDGTGIGHFKGHPTVSADIAHNIMFRLRFSNSDINMVDIIVRNHEFFHDSNISKAAIKRLINKVGVDAARWVIDLNRADIIGQGTGLDRGDVLDKYEDIINEIVNDNEALSLKDLAVNGNDIMNLGCKGKEVGEVLNYLLQLVISEKVDNEKYILINSAMDYLSGIRN